MNRTQGWGLLVAVGVLSAIGADDPVAAEMKRLEGKREIVALESQGEKIEGKDLESLKANGWTFKGSKVTFADGSVGQPVESTYKVDPAKDPKEIDITAGDGPMKGKTMAGIYRIEDGRLTLCLRSPEAKSKERPRRFATEPRSGLILMTLDRPKP